MSTTFLNVSFAAYLVASLCYVAHLLSKKKSLGIASTGLLILGVLFHAAALIGRWRLAGHFPATSLYESSILFSWSMVVVYLVVEARYKVRLLGPFVSVLALLSLGYASLLNSTIEPLVPALQSNWLAIHVAVCFAGYAAFAVSFVAAVVYLVICGRSANNPESLVSRLDVLAYKTIAFGFPFLTLGIITGAVWANQAWGTYWGWDPKETWSLITWLIYAAYLHARITAGWRGKKAAWLSVVGFLAVIFTYLGVNFLLAGLHSYGPS
ncbi:MAG: c-type cytochrome biogenesis protein CcsB [Candidatus Latescibacterota bacterium]